MKLLDKAVQLQTAIQLLDLPKQQCFCGNQAVHRHHIVPQSYGGPATGPTVRICSQCHHTIHAAASAALCGKPVDIGVKPQIYIITRDLVEVIILAALANQYTDNPNQLRKVVLQLPDELLKKLHQRKTDVGFSNLPDFISSVLHQLVR